MKAAVFSSGGARRLHAIFPTVLLALTICAGCEREEGAPTGGPRRENRDGYKLVWLEGSAYDMGYQHGKLLHEEIGQAVQFVQSDPLYAFILNYGRRNGIVAPAEANSYQDLLDECRGLANATADVGMTMDICLLLNFGDVLMERVQNDLLAGWPVPTACVGIAAGGNASGNGSLYHARILDWTSVDFVIRNPVIFVRRPANGLAHVAVGFPGNISPYQGMNEAGISASSNEVDPRNRRFMATSGRSHVQMLGQILKSCRTLADAERLIRSAKHMSSEILVVSDANARQAAVFDLSPRAIGVRRSGAKGLVYATNHFLSPAAVNMDEDPADASSLLRYDRLSQLLEPGRSGSLYGRLDPAGLIRVMRDRVNAWTGEEYPADVVDNDRSLATHGCLYAIVFDGARLQFWVAAGAVPVPQQSFVGFSLAELAGLPDAAPVSPPVFP
jgi:hypothetical protein